MLLSDASDVMKNLGCSERLGIARWWVVSSVLLCSCSGVARVLLGSF